MSASGRAPRLWAIAAVAIAVAASAAAGAALWRREAQSRFAAAVMAADPDAILSAGDGRLRARLLARGGQVYARACARCHGADLEGDSQTGAPALGDADWLYGEGMVSEIERTVLHGVRADDPMTRQDARMPAYARDTPVPETGGPPLSPHDIEAVADYLIARRTSAAEAFSEGREIYFGKGGCVDCHAPDAKGDAAIGAPNLVDSTWLRGRGDKADLVQAISQGAAGVCPAWAKHLSKVDIRALAVFVAARARRAE